MLGIRLKESATAIALTILGRRLKGGIVTDVQQLADAFWQMNRAALRIHEIFNRNPALAENLPLRPLVLDTDEFADECRLLAEYYEKPAR
jgi:hypothetical protein